MILGVESLSILFKIIVLFRNRSPFSNWDSGDFQAKIRTPGKNGEIRSQKCQPALGISEQHGVLHAEPPNTSLVFVVVLLLLLLFSWAVWWQNRFRVFRVHTDPFLSRGSTSYK